MRPALKGLGALIVALSAAAQLAAAVPLYTDDNVPPAVMKQMLEAQDLALNLHYEESEKALAQHRLAIPGHPVGNLFLLATRLSWMQERFKNGDKAIPKDFFPEINKLIEEAQAQMDAHPKEAYPRYYLGAAFGCRGLAKLFAKHYLDSYFDGKNGVALIKEAIAIDPTIYNAYMGLGQFEYYSGSLGSVLRFFLALEGDEEKGLALLKTCAEKSTYASWPCRIYRMKLLVTERKNYAEGAPELAVCAARYSDNYELGRLAFTVLDAGQHQPALIQVAANYLDRLEKGWKVPPYAQIDFEKARAILAAARKAEGQP
jgi:hypothetical protein